MVLQVTRWCCFELRFLFLLVCCYQSCFKEPSLICCQFGLFVVLCFCLGCTDTPFLMSCRCRTRVGHQNGYDSPDSRVWRVSFFFIFLASLTQHRHRFDTSDMLSVKKKKRKKKEERKSQILKPTSQVENLQTVESLVDTRAVKKKKQKITDFDSRR